MCFLRMWQAFILDGAAPHSNTPGNTNCTDAGVIIKSTEKVATE
jgi:hypothetical protein